MSTYQHKSFNLAHKACVLLWYSSSSEVSSTRHPVFHTRNLEDSSLRQVFPVTLPPFHLTLRCKLYVPSENCTGIVNDDHLLNNPQLSTFFASHVNFLTEQLESWKVNVGLSTLFYQNNYSFLHQQEGVS